MLQFGNGEESFCLYAMELFSKAGHVASSEPEFANHTPERFVFFDSKREMAFSKGQRALLTSFSNVSRLFSCNGCVFFSINLLSSRNSRSQTAHDIHTMIHPGVGSKGTVCLFKFEDEIMLSFMGFGLRCILSDWYPIDDDYDTLLDKLHIVNMSINSDIDYFEDMIYSLARYYYRMPKDPVIYDLLPINYFSEHTREDIDRDELDQMVANELLKPQREYGDDYVEYDESETGIGADISSDLDLMLLEIDDADEDIGNPFDEILESDDEEADEMDNETVGTQDEYEYDEVDPEIFIDPSLMVKWIQKHDQ